MHPTVDSILDANKYNLHDAEINTQANQDVIEIQNFHDVDKYEMKNDEDTRFPNAIAQQAPRPPEAQGQVARQGGRRLSVRLSLGIATHRCGCRITVEGYCCGA